MNRYGYIGYLFLGAVMLVIVLNCARETTTYSNPIIHADYSDPDVIRVGDDFYMVSSSFAHTPGLPVLQSKDLVNWKIIGHAIENLPHRIYEKPQHGKGVWAPSIRYYQGEFRIYYGDPDFGIYMVRAKNPAGPWKRPVLIKAAQGRIDPCPFWDDDGSGYLVHAWAKSRSGFNSILTLCRLNEDGTRITDEGTTIFDGHTNHPTIEGPKMYKRDGFYYIFAPAGGVKEGWQTVLRSKNIYGPYEDKIVLEQGSTRINGPHQGAWVQTQARESWFIHFQDKAAYGRIVHLNPVKWVAGWPVMGTDFDGNGIGEPVAEYRLPLPDEKEIFEIQTGDEFESENLGLQWQWQANHSDEWYSLTDKPGYLRLYSVELPEDNENLWDVAAIPAQKFPAEEFEVTTRLSLMSAGGDRAGLVVIGLDYACLAISRNGADYFLTFAECKNADAGTAEVVVERIPVQNAEIFLGVAVRKGGRCSFKYSEDGARFHSIGREFQARKGKWVGAKVGLFCARQGNKSGGYVDIDFFRIDPGDQGNV
ncbi:MAG: glycoside hydrolase family 43 protein [Fidelibacterota bacterium]